MLDVLPSNFNRTEISPCGQYRYTLSLRWNPAAPAVMFIMLNPSTADAR